jgi:hypothetical protein
MMLIIATILIQQMFTLVFSPELPAHSYPSCLKMLLQVQAVAFNAIH